MTSTIMGYAHPTEDIKAGDLVAVLLNEETGKYEINNVDQGLFQ
jgi:hypothetical protein